MVTPCSCVHTGWSAAAYALVGRADLAEMASAAAEAEAVSKQAPAQAVRAAPSMALQAGVLEAARLGVLGSGDGRRPQLSPLWQPKLRTPAPGARPLKDLLKSQLLCVACKGPRLLRFGHRLHNQMPSLPVTDISRTLCYWHQSIEMHRAPLHGHHGLSHFKAFCGVVLNICSIYQRTLACIQASTHNAAG